MTEIERKALALVNEGRPKNRGLISLEDARNTYSFMALCRAIEQHEAFKQEVSDVAEACQTYTAASYIKGQLNRFIIAKPDPLVEALEEASGTNDPVEWANRFYAAIEKRGGKIVWGEG